MSAPTPRDPASRCECGAEKSDPCHSLDPALLNTHTYDPADPTPVPPHLSDAEREGAAVCGVDCRPGDGLCNGYCHDARVKAPPAIRLAPPLDRALAQLTRGAEGNGANLGAVECRALLTALSSEREAGERDRKDNRELRKEWWLAHCAGIHAGNIAALYGDDGEMQCSACRLDFKRQPVAELQAELWLLALKRAAAPSTETPR